MLGSKTFPTQTCSITCTLRLLIRWRPCAAKILNLRRSELEPHADLDSPRIKNACNVRAPETLPILVVEILRRRVRIRRRAAGLLRYRKHRIAGCRRRLRRVNLAP